MIKEIEKLVIKNFNPDAFHLASEELGDGKYLFHFGIMGLWCQVLVHTNPVEVHYKGVANMLNKKALELDIERLLGN